MSAAAAIPALSTMSYGGLIPDLFRGASKYGAGVHFEPRPTSFSPKIGAFSFATFLAPAPVGIVPPELYQVNPSWLRNDVTGDIPAQEFLGVKVNETREKVFLSERAERTIIHAVLKDYSITGRVQDLSVFTTAELVAMRDFLRATEKTQFRSPLALNALNAEINTRPNDALPVEGTGITVIPSPTDPRFASVTPQQVQEIRGGGFNPSSVRPLMLTAMAVIKASEFLRRELLTERADP